MDVQTLKIYCEVPSADDNEMGCCDIPGKEKAEFVCYLSLVSKISSILT